MKKKWKDSYSPLFTGISIYVILTATAIFGIAKLFYYLEDILLAIQRGASFVGTLLLPLGIGFALAYLLYPLMKFFERHLGKVKRLRKKQGRIHSLAVAITVISTFLVIFLGLSLIVSTLTKDLRMLQADDLTNYIQSFAVTLQTFADNFAKWVEEQNIASSELNQVMQSLSDWGNQAIQSIGSVLLGWASQIPQIFTNLVFAIIFGIYFLLDGDGLRKYWDRVLKAISSKKIYQGIHELLQEADRVFSGYIRGQLIDAVLMDVMISIALTIIDVKYAVIIGLLTGIGNLIPYVGPVVAYASTILVCVMSQDWQKMVIAVIVIFVIQTIDGNVINPKLLSSNVNVHPMLVIASLIIGGAVGGIFGMLLAVPVAALLKNLFDRMILAIIARREARKESSGE